ncbi:DUF2141 domain-containing protein [Alteromonas sp. CYL-A6]|uniref:DUF2141 domain-containing protein n=1 Tax=Alteromonas nitratireducens TaxID=3390813 RepID=UPI0034AF37C9
MKKIISVLALTLPSVFSVTAAATDKVTFQVALNGVKTGHAPLYVSVQDANKIRTSSANAGVILRELNEESVTVDLEVEPGVYAVSVWHDLDEDGKFSMGKNYIPTDGWGASGTPPRDRAPSFDDMKIEIFQNGQVIAVDMDYATE